MTKHKSQKHAFDDGSEDQTLDDLCSYRVLLFLQLCQLCAHSLGMSRDSLASTLHQRMYNDYPVYAGMHAEENVGSKKPLLAGETSSAYLIRIVVLLV